jgi:hypothetical protein
MVLTHGWEKFVKFLKWNFGIVKFEDAQGSMCRTRHLFPMWVDVFHAALCAKMRMTHNILVYTFCPQDLQLQCKESHIQFPSFKSWHFKLANTDCLWRKFMLLVLCTLLLLFICSICRKSFRKEYLWEEQVNYRIRLLGPDCVDQMVCLWASNS